MKSSKRPSKDSPRPKSSGKTNRDERPKRSFDSSNERPKRTFDSSNERPKRTFDSSNERPKRTFDSSNERPKRTFDSSNERPKRTFNSNEERPKRSFDSNSERPKRTFNSNEERPKRSFDSNSDRPKRTFDSNEERPRRTFDKDAERPKRTFDSNEERPRRTFDKDAERPKRSFDSETGEERPKREKPVRDMRPRTKTAPGKSMSSFKANDKGIFKPQIDKLNAADDDDVRLNKYVAQSGIAARRKAGEMILAGEITVNGKVIAEPGYRVLPKDVVKYKGAELKPVERKIYLLMNKPKNTITTVSDEKGRKTVIDLVRRTVKERVFPVGRLDRDTTGLLLLTNDGDLAQVMAHPSYRIKKLYHVILDKPVTKSDLEGIATGVELEDGLAEVDGVQYVNGATKNEVMIEIHIGKNRIVRRIFEHLGYEVTRLDRVFYGGLTKKDLPRSGYRTLTDRELIMLKHFTGK